MGPLTFCLSKLSSPVLFPRPPWRLPLQCFSRGGKQLSDPDSSVRCASPISDCGSGPIAKAAPKKQAM